MNFLFVHSLKLKDLLCLLLLLSLFDVLSAVLLFVYLGSLFVSPSLSDDKLHCIDSLTHAGV